MTDPIGVRIDENIKNQIKKDAKKASLAVSTYASKILTNWTTLYKPMLEGGSTLFPISLLKIFYNSIPEESFDSVAKSISEYWQDSIKSTQKSPKYEDYLESLELWMSLTGQKLSILGHDPTKHVINHSWGMSYSKITCHVLKNTWENLGFKFEEIELKKNLLSYNLFN